MFLRPASDTDELGSFYTNGAVADNIQHLGKFKCLVFPGTAGEDQVQCQDLLASGKTVRDNIGGGFAAVVIQHNGYRCSIRALRNRSEPHSTGTQLIARL